MSKKVRINNPPIFTALLRQYDSAELYRFARRLWFQEPWDRIPTTRFSEVVDGRFATPNRHSDLL